MLTPREQGGGLGEASRLLQEGLQLLDERQREVDAILEEARERALDIKAEAEQHAQQITADAEAQRAELEEQVAALRSEVASLREELAALRSPTADPRSPTASARSPTADTRSPTADTHSPTADTHSPTADTRSPTADTHSPTADTHSPTADTRSATAETFEHQTEPGTMIPPDARAEEVAEAAEAPGTPRWGRSSTIAAAQRAVRSGGSRPRWLPPWLPFLLILVVAPGIVATTPGQAAPRAVRRPSRLTAPRQRPIPDCAQPR